MPVPERPQQNMPLVYLFIGLFVIFAVHLCTVYETFALHSYQWWCQLHSAGHQSHRSSWFQQCHWQRPWYLLHSPTGYVLTINVLIVFKDGETKKRNYLFKLTPRFLMALFRSLTTSIPSTPLVLKRLVHVSKTACKNTITMLGFYTWILIVFMIHSFKTGKRIIRYFITSSNFVWAHGNENVNPTGSFLSLIFCFSMKSPRHSATWSNSCGKQRTKSEDK